MPRSPKFHRRSLIRCLKRLLIYMSYLQNRDSGSADTHLLTCFRILRLKKTLLWGCRMRSTLCSKYPNTEYIESDIDTPQPMMSAAKGKYNSFTVKERTSLDVLRSLAIALNFERANLFLRRYPMIIP